MMVDLINIDTKIFIKSLPFITLTWFFIIKSKKIKGLSLFINMEVNIIENIEKLSFILYNECYWSLIGAGYILLIPMIGVLSLIK